MTKRKVSALDMVELSNGVLVPRRVHDALYPLAYPKIERLSYDRPYKSRDMLEPNDYVRFEPWHVGCCIADWERTGRIPVTFLGCRFCSVRFYGRT